MNEFIRMAKEKADAAELKLNDSIHEMIEVHLKQSNDEQTQRIIIAVTESNEALNVSIRSLQETVIKSISEIEKKAKKSWLQVVQVALEFTLVLGIGVLIFMNR